MQAVQTTTPAAANNYSGIGQIKMLSERELLAMPEGDYMNMVQLGFFKAMLVEQKHRLTRAAGHVSREADQAEPNADPSDRASAEEAHSQALRAAMRDGQALERIENALRLIETGEYGWCADTGDAIGLPRLIAQPTAELSVEAQQRREKLKKFNN